MRLYLGDNNDYADWRCLYAITMCDPSLWCDLGDFIRHFCACAACRFVSGRCCRDTRKAGSRSIMGLLSEWVSEWVALCYNALKRCTGRRVDSTWWTRIHVRSNVPQTRKLRVSLSLSVLTTADRKFARAMFRMCRTLIFVFVFIPFSVFTLLVRRQEGHPACKQLGVGLLVMIWLELCTSYSCSCRHHYLHHPLLQ